MPVSATCPRAKHHDAIGVLHGAKPVRNHERGAVVHQLGHGILHVAFGLGVERRGGFVEHQGSAHSCKARGDGDALALAAREADALGTDVGVESCGQAFDEFKHMRRTRRFNEAFFVHYPGRTVNDVVADGVVEQQRFPPHEREVRAQIGKFGDVKIDTVEQDRVRAHRIEKRGNKLAYLVLLPPEAPTSATVSPGLDGERHAIKRIHGRRRVTQTHVAVFDFPFHGFQFDGPGIRLGRFINQVEHALRCGQTRLRITSFTCVRRLVGLIMELTAAMNATKVPAVMLPKFSAT